MFKNLKLHHYIIISMFAGLIIGLLFNLNQEYFSPSFKADFFWWTRLLGKDLFIGSLKMIIAPLILASIVSGICSLPNVSKIGDIGGKTFLYYFLTTTIAVPLVLSLYYSLLPVKKKEANP